MRKIIKKIFLQENCLILNKIAKTKSSLATPPKFCFLKKQLFVLQKKTKKRKFKSVKILMIKRNLNENSLKKFRKIVYIFYKTTNSKPTHPFVGNSRKNNENFCVFKFPTIWPFLCECISELELNF